MTDVSSLDPDIVELLATFSREEGFALRSLTVEPLHEGVVTKALLEGGDDDCLLELVFSEDEDSRDMTMRFVARDDLPPAASSSGRIGAGRT